MNSDVPEGLNPLLEEIKGKPYSVLPEQKLLSPCGLLKNEQGYFFLTRMGNPMQCEKKVLDSQIQETSSLGNKNKVTNLFHPCSSQCPQFNAFKSGDDYVVNICQGVKHPIKRADYIVLAKPGEPTNPNGNSPLSKS